MIMISRNAAGIALTSTKSLKMLLMTNFDPGSSDLRFVRTKGSMVLYTDTAPFAGSKQGVGGLAILSKPGVHPTAPTLFTKNFLAPMSYSFYSMINSHTYLSLSLILYSIKLIKTLIFFF